MRASHSVSADFDDPSLVSTAGLLPVMSLAEKAGANGTITVRADSAYYDCVATAACTAGVRLSITARMDPAVTAAISRIPANEWTPIQFPNTIIDEQEGRWTSDTEVAEVPYTAFTAWRKSEHVSARLIVRRVRRLNPSSVRAGQNELLAAYRHHAVFTDSTLEMLEASDRDRANVEQVIADVKNGPLAHLPSGVFTADAAWLACAVMAFNLTRTAGVIASRRHGRARTATIRAQLVQVPARIANHARKWRLHLATLWPWQAAWENLFRHGHSTATAIA